MTEAEDAPAGVDLTVPNVARIYDYILGGKIHFQVDRDVARRMQILMPEMADAAWANRGFLQRAVRWMAESGGIRQFIDIGAGLPTQNNTHDAAQKVAPDARVIYVDHDPMAVKPTLGELGVDVGALAWQRSGAGDGAIEIAFVHEPAGAPGDWVLMRLSGDPSGRVLAYDRNEWECFLDGVKKGEFDDGSG